MHNSISNESNSSIHVSTINHKNNIHRTQSELLPIKTTLGQFLDTIENIEDYTISVARKKVYIKLASYSTSNLMEISHKIKRFDSNVEIIELERVYSIN